MLLFINDSSVSWLLLSALFTVVILVNKPCSPSHGYAYLPSVKSAVLKCESFQHCPNIFSLCSVKTLVQLLSQYIFVKAPQLKNMPGPTIFTPSTSKLILIDGVFEHSEKVLLKEIAPNDEELAVFTVHADKSIGVVILIQLENIRSKCSTLLTFHPDTGGIVLNFA